MEVEQKKKILIQMESIVGNRCYNGNIQNWGPNGEWYGEGREFRYPITFLDKGVTKEKRWEIDPSESLEKMRTGYYAFGANHLNIVQALEDILKMLESEYHLEER